MRRNSYPLLLISFVLAIALIALSAFLPIYANIALADEIAATASIPTVTYSNGQQQLLAPDWSQITWGNLPPVEEPGWIKLSSKFTQKLGYDPSRTWYKGERPDQFIRLGDVESAFHLEAFKLEDISQLTKIATDSLPLNSLGLVGSLTPKTLVKAIPQLQNLSVSEVAPLQDLLKSGGGKGQGTVGQLLKNPNFANLKLGVLDLSQYKLQSIPGLDKTALGKFRGWQQSAISSVPGLSSVPFDKFPQSILSGIQLVGIVDGVWSPAEHGDPKVNASYFISGTVNKKDQTVPVACAAGKPCAYAELSDPAGAGGSLHGKRWASGKTQKVKGGFGVLGKVNGGWEPAGKLVFGSAFKVVLLDTDETKGSVTFGLFFRFCSRGLPDLGCTPYFVGPIPWIPAHEKGAVIVASVSTPKVNIPFKYQQQLDKIRRQYQPPTQAASDEATSTGCIGRVTGDAVNRAIAAAPDGMRSDASNTVPLVMAAAKSYGVTDPAQVAYILSTVQTETTMGANLTEGATRNKSAPGSVFYGRGLVQLTGEENYRKASALVGVDLVKNPELASDPEISSKILVVGMRDGMFTGRKLSDYIGNGKANFAAARQIVNDSDKQDAMATDAQRYLSAISGTSIASLQDTGSTCVASTGTVTTSVAAGAVQQRIYTAAMDSYGMDSSQSGLPGGGKVACAWAVNKVLNNAGIPAVGNNPNLVFSVRDSLEAGRGQEISDRSAAKAGDLALALGSGDKQHIGVCLNDGCTQVLSNSSSKQSFRWKSDTDFGGYYGVKSKIYRVTK